MSQGQGHQGKGSSLCKMHMEALLHILLFLLIPTLATTLIMQPTEWSLVLLHILLLLELGVFTLPLDV